LKQQQLKMAFTSENLRNHSVQADSDSSIFFNFLKETSGSDRRKECSKKLNKESAQKNVHTAQFFVHTNHFFKTLLPFENSYWLLNIRDTL
jgi:hypothetical protein